MKTISKLVTALLIAVSLVGTPAMSEVHNSSYSFNKLAQSLCKITKSDQLYQLRSQLRRAKTHIRTIYPQIDCDGQTLLSLAVSSQAQSIVSYLKLKARPEAAVKVNHLITSM